MCQSSGVDRSLPTSDTALPQPVQPGGSMDALFPLSRQLPTSTSSLGVIDYAVVDAFTETPFKGNPAAVCLLPCWYDVCWMQKVAAEFNLSQTAFLVRKCTPDILAANDDMDNISLSNACIDFDVRWFTPSNEVDLCGHATLASSYLLFMSGIVSGDLIQFHSRNCGILKARRVKISSKDDTVNLLVELDFPILSCSECDFEPMMLSNTLQNITPLTICKTSANDILVELPHGEHVESLKPCLDEMRKLNARGVIVTGRASEHSGFDFISRFFAPKVGIEEDPVCGQAHCALAGFWAKKLNKRSMMAYQASKRSGTLHIKIDFETNRVYIQGAAVLVMTGILINKTDQSL